MKTDLTLNRIFPGTDKHQYEPASQGQIETDTLQSKTRKIHHEVERQDRLHPRRSGTSFMGIGTTGATIPAQREQGQSKTKGCCPRFLQKERIVNEIASGRAAQ